MGACMGRCGSRWSGPTRWGLKRLFTECLLQVRNRLRLTEPVQPARDVFVQGDRERTVGQAGGLRLDSPALRACSIGAGCMGPRGPSGELAEPISTRRLSMHAHWRVTHGCEGIAPSVLTLSGVAKEEPASRHGARGPPRPRSCCRVEPRLKPPRLAEAQSMPNRRALAGSTAALSHRRAATSRSFSGASA